MFVRDKHEYRMEPIEFTGAPIHRVARPILAATEEKSVVCCLDAVTVSANSMPIKIIVSFSFITSPL